MASLRVDIDKLKTTIEQLESLITDIGNLTDVAICEAENVRLHWQGEDADMFVSELDGIKSDDSMNNRYIEAVRNYLHYLETARNMYDAARNRAIERANNIPL